MNRKNKIFIGIVAILIVIITIFFFMTLGGKDETNEVIIKENVKIITSETKLDLQPINVTENRLIFSNDPDYKIGDIVVSGIIKSANNGFIRRVVSINETEGIYEYITEEASLKDVFEKASFVKTFIFTTESVEDISVSETNVVRLNTIDISNTKNNENSKILKTSTVVKQSDDGLGIVLELNEKISDNIELAGEVELVTYLELNVDIENDDITFGMATHTNSKGELLIGYQGKLFDDENENSDGKYEQEIFNKALPNIQFFIGSVPIVLTNDFLLSMEISAQLEGQIGTTIKVDSEQVQGFKYDSKTGKISEINDNYYLSDGIEWNTEIRANGNFEGGLYTHIISKLYDCTGTDLSFGLAANINGELALGVDETLSPLLYGNLNLSIEPKSIGKIIVTKPVIDENLFEAEILKVNLPPLWELIWETPDPMLIAMQKGNFTCFTGEYIALTEFSEMYGGGHELNLLEIKKDGSLTGGGAWFLENFYLETSPITVTKNEDGTYLCTLDENNYYVICPIGVIEENYYWLEEKQPNLKNSVYIRTFKYDGGILEVIYYSDDTNLFKT